MNNRIYKIPGNFNQDELHLENVGVSGFYSIDSKCKYHSDSSQLKYLYPTFVNSQTLEQPFDLNLDYEKIVPKLNDGSSSFKHISQWLMENWSLTKGKDFVCFRGLFSTEMLKCLVENKIDWRIAAYRIGSTIYLCSFDTEKKKIEVEKQKLSPDQVRSSNWGFKFEQFMLSEDPLLKPNGKGELHMNEEFSVIFHGQLRNFKLLYGAEMDGIISESKINPSNVLDELKKAEFVELKTGKPMGLKMIKWWAQSYLVGINKIICGEKKENKVKSLTQLNVNQILSKMNYKGRNINESNCCHFIADILQFIQDQVFSVKPGKYCLFEWDPQQRWKITASTTDNEYYRFLSEEFVDFMESKETNLREEERTPNSLKRSHEDESISGDRGEKRYRRDVKE